MWLTEPGIPESMESSGCYTFQVAIKEDGHWVREYVCAENKYAAVFEFLEMYPHLTLEFLLAADEFHVEACD